MTTPGSAVLVRGIRRWDMVAIVINIVIGAGIFGLPSKVYALIGPYSVAAFISCALVVALVVFCFAEVSSRFSGTGGPYLYAREAFGPVTGFEVGWLMWLTRVTALAANCNLLASYTAHFFPAADEGLWRAGLITTVVLVLALINIRGIRQAAIASNFFTVGKLLPLLIFVAAGMFFLNASGFERVTHPGYTNFSTSVLLLIYAFTGFEVATVTAGESRDPTRDLPFAMILAIAGVAIIYVLIQVVCIGTLPELATSERPLADAALNFLGARGAALIALGALISITGNLNGTLLGGSRLIYAMAEQRELPHVLARTHPRFRTPHVSILMTAAIVLALAISGSFIYALTLSTITRLLTYVATSAALPILRSRHDAPPAAFRLRGGLAISILTLLLVLWLLSNSTWTEARDVAIAALIGLLIYIFYKLKERRSLGV